MAANTTLQIIIQAKDQASAVLRDTAKETDGLGSKLKTLAVGLGTALAGFASFRALEGAIEKTTEMGEAVRTLSREAGISSEESSRLIVAFEKVGLSAGDAERSFGIFAKNLVNTRDNMLQGQKVTSPFADSLKVLHINAIGASGALLPFDQILNQVADQFAALPDGEEKAARAIDLFGRSGRDMIPLLNLGSKGLKEAADEADHLGLTLSGANVEKIHGFVLAQRQMNEAIAGVKLQIGLELMPVLTRFANWFTEHQGDVRKFVDDAGTRVVAFVRDFKSGFDIIQSSLQWIPDNQGTVIAGITAIGAAMLLAFGPESLAVAGIAAAMAGLGKIATASQKEIVAKGDRDVALHLPGGITLHSGGLLNQLILGQSQPLSNQQVAAIQQGNTPSIANLGESLGKGLIAVDAHQKELADSAQKASVDLDALGGKFTTLGSALDSTLGTIRSAAQALEGQPTQEQARLQLRADQLARDIANFPALRPGDRSGNLDALNREKAKVDRELADLDAKHKIDADSLTLADKTLLTEAQRKTATEELLVKTKDLTGKLKDTADAAGLHLIPSFDDVMNANLNLRDTLLNEVIPGHKAANQSLDEFTTKVKTAAGALANLLIGGSGNPNMIPDKPFLVP
jgi:hypothetical protein